MAIEIILSESSKAIPLTKGKFAIVDAADYEWLMQWKWCFDGRYAVRGNYIEGADGKKKQTTVRMHSVIMGTPKGMQTDHIDGDGLNNRRINMRICVTKENIRNSFPHKGRSSAYKGVGWHNKHKKWRAYIRANYAQKHLGYFEEETAAALAYNEAAIKHFGEFARLNEV